MRLQNLIKLSHLFNTQNRNVCKPQELPQIKHLQKSFVEK